MPRVKEIDDARGDPILEELFAKERAIYGDLLNPTKVMAHCPPILRAAKMLSASIAESGTLPKGLAALVSLRVAAINGCPFWVDINSVRVTDIDGGDQKVADLGGWRESSAFSDLEGVALEYAERMTYTGQKVDDAIFGRLKEHFSEPQIVELTAVIALENFRSKFNPALDVKSQGFCLLPQR